MVFGSAVKSAVHTPSGVSVVSVQKGCASTMTVASMSHVGRANGGIDDDSASPGTMVDYGH